MIQTTTIKFDKKALFNRFAVDVGLLIEKSNTIDAEYIGIAEHDTLWFEVALNRVSSLVVDELNRIAKDVEEPITNIVSDISFQVLPINKRQAILLPEAIERCLITQLVNSWFEQHALESVVDVEQAITHLKHITLINNGINRLTNY